MACRKQLQPRITRRAAAVGLSLGCAVLFAGAAAANPLPRGTIRLVVPVSAGGPADTVARILADRLQSKVERTLVVENRVGAGGNVGAASVAKSEPDGLTWLFALDSIFTINPHMYKSLGFERSELSAVTLVGDYSQLLVVTPSVPAATLSEFIAHARTKPVTYASAGVGSPGHLTFEYLKKTAGFEATHVPYRGNAPAVTDLLGGRVDAGFLVSSGVINYVQEKTLRPLAVSGRKRLQALPDVPTVSESGFPNFDARFAFLMMLPAKTPDEIKQFVAKEVADVIGMPGVREKLAALALEPTTSTPEEATAWLAQENKRWAEIVSSAGIKPE